MKTKKRNVESAGVDSLDPLFIPLRKEYFEGFEQGRKTKEYRKYGPRWNERVCIPGRKVILSCGYGKQRRINGVIVSFWKRPRQIGDIDFVAVYGLMADTVAEIGIKV